MAHVDVSVFSGGVDPAGAGTRKGGLFIYLFFLVFFKESRLPCRANGTEGAEPLNVVVLGGHKLPGILDWRGELWSCRVPGRRLSIWSACRDRDIDGVRSDGDVAQEQVGGLGMLLYILVIDACIFLLLGDQEEDQEEGVGRKEQEPCR